MERKKEKLDRRVQRTRQLLNEALISLIAEQGYDSITVQNIIDRANVGRSTFYAHYQDKEDLLLKGMAEIVHSLILDIESPSNGLNGAEAYPRILSATPLFEHTQEQHRLYKAMVGGRGVEVIIKTIQQHLSSHIQNQIEQLLPAEQSPAIDLTVVATYLAGALLTLLTWWLDNNMPYSPTEMDEMFQGLTMPGVWAMLGMTKAG